MLIGYNPKIYLKEFLEDLVLFYKEKDVNITIKNIDSVKDIYSVKCNDKQLCDVTLYDIINYDNNMYQELKFNNFDTNDDILNLLFKHEYVQIIQRTLDNIIFIVTNDIIVSE